VDVYRITFRGGERAEIAVSGGGDTHLDLYVYDENGNLITSGAAASDDEYVRFNPVWRGPFGILRNLGCVYNQYLFLSN
jgi:hypothetical protein